MLTRYQVHANIQIEAIPEAYYTCLGTEFQDGYSSGTGEGHRHLDESTLDQVDFVGYHLTTLPSDDTFFSTVWFTVDEYFGRALPVISGCYRVELGVDGPVDS